MRRAHMSLQGLAVLVLLALVGSCDNDTTGPFPNPLLAVAELGAQFEKVTISREGVPVTDATVTINGVAIPHTFAGIYQGQLPTAVPAGSPLNLQVSTGGATVQGTVNVPEAPVVTAPATGAAFEGGDTIAFTWTSATNPERFIVSASRVVDGVNIGKTFLAPGGGRELRIAASELLAGADLPISVIACNGGSFTGPVDPESRMGICAQNPPHATITVSGDRRLALVVAELGTRFQNVTITREGVPVTNGRVTVNWVAIPHVGDGNYQGQLPAAVPAGSSIDLVLGAAGTGMMIYAVGTGTLPEAPILTAPVTGAAFDGGDSITVTWTSATNPERFVVSGSRVVDGVTIGKSFTAAGTARELRIAASELPAGADLPISVVACNDGSFTGLVQPDSRMGICAPSPLNATITISTAASPLRISGGVGAQSQNIWIFQGGWDLTDGVSDAVVTVNGVTIPNVGGRLYPGYYHGELPAAVPPGSPLDLRVSARGLVVEATDNVPEVPVVATPAAGAVFAPGSSITVRWTSLTNPDRFAVYVNTNEPVWHRELPGTARELEIAASELPAGSDLAIGVVAYNDGSFTGPAHSDSRMGIMSVGGPRVITIKP